MNCLLIHGSQRIVGEDLDAHEQQLILDLLEVN